MGQVEVGNINWLLSTILHIFDGSRYSMLDLPSQQWRLKFYSLWTSPTKICNAPWMAIPQEDV